MPLKEQLADLAHKMWSGWMKWMFNIGTFNKDGTWTMPKESVERWTRQLSTSYANLSEHEKESDRKEADRMIEVYNR